MRANHRANTVNCVLVFTCVCGECCVNRFLESLESVCYLYNVCAENFHSCNVRCLLFDVNSAHIDVALESKIGCRSGKCNTVLTCTGLGDNLFLAHIFCKECLAHTVIELMRSGMVKVLALDVKLHVANRGRKALEIGNGGRSALELAANLAKLTDKFTGFTDREICVCDLFHRILQIGRDIGTAVFAEKAVLIGVILKLGIEFNVIVFHSNFLLK